MLAAGPQQAKAASGLAASRSGRRVLFAVLYFAEGAPIGFVWWTLPALFALEGVPVERVGALSSLFALPWALKFLWAPLVDLTSAGRIGLRGWILAAQAVMVASLVPLAFVPLGRELPLVTGLLLVHAFAAATQDVAIDALAIRSAPEPERGELNGWMQVGLQAGRGLFGGAVLVLSEPGDASAVVWALVVVIAATAVVHALYRAPAAERRPRALAAYGHVLREVARLRSTWLVLAFAATGGVAFELVGALAGPYLVARGEDQRSIGSFYVLVAVAALALGALAGGRLSDRLGRRRTVAAAGAALALVVGGLALASGGEAARWSWLGATYLLAGGFMAASYALFMALCDRRLAALQFSAAMGATNLCEAWAARLGGAVAGSRGYPAAFGLGSVLGALALALLALLRIPPARRPASR